MQCVNATTTLSMVLQVVSFTFDHHYENPDQPVIRYEFLNSRISRLKGQGSLFGLPSQQAMKVRSKLCTCCVWLHVLDVMSREHKRLVALPILHCTKQLVHGCGLPTLYSCMLYCSCAPVFLVLDVAFVQYCTMQRNEQSWLLYTIVC